MDDINTVIECMKESNKKSLLMRDENLNLMSQFSKIFVDSLEDDPTDSSNHTL
jgi:hypothetical protein